jgi:methyl-accepting chemotaxis protein
MFDLSLLKTRLWLLALISGATFIAMGGYSIWQSTRSEVVVRQFVDHELPMERASMSAYAQGLQMGQALRNILLDPKNVKGYENHQRALGSLTQSLDSLVKGLEEDKDVKGADALKSAASQWLVLQKNVIADIQRGEFDAAKELLVSQETPAWRVLRDLLLVQVKTQQDLVRTARDDLLGDLANSRIFASVIGVVGLLVVSLVTLWVALGVFRRLGGEPCCAAEIMERIARGDLTRDVPIDARNPNSLLGTMALMQQQLKTLITEISRGARTLVASVDGMRENASKVTEVSEEQSLASAAIAAAVEQLTVSISVMAENANAVTQLTVDMAQQVRQSIDAMGRATDTIEHVANAMTQSTDAVGDLSLRAESINGIVKTIQEIAAQTNLLALNAAIEAARAGEQGRGFAVVADEVRKLAERTEVSTKEISSMIQGVQAGTAVVREKMGDAKDLALQGAQLTEQVRTAVTGLNQSAIAVKDAVESIALALLEQRAASTDIAQRVEMIAQGSEQTHTSMADSSEKAEDLARLAHSLQARVEHFRLPGNA